MFMQKDKSYASEYGTYGYAYAKTLINNGKSEEGLKLYNSISKFTNGANLSDSNLCSGCETWRECVSMTKL